MSKGKGTYKKVTSSKSGKRKKSTTQTVKKPKTKPFSFYINVDNYGNFWDKSHSAYFSEFAERKKLNMFHRIDDRELAFTKGNDVFVELYIVDEYGKVKMLIYNFEASLTPYRKTLGTAKTPVEVFNLINEGMRIADEHHMMYAERFLP